jgi:hypothetical protein
MEWADALNALAGQVQTWVNGDLAKRSHIEGQVVARPEAGVPMVAIDVDSKTIVRLEPAEFGGTSLPTNVHLYTYPTLRRVVLEGPDQNNAWQVVTSQGIPMRYGWNEADFLDLIQVLAEPYATKSL